MYRLIDPRNGETFHVGNGKGNSVFIHAHAAPYIIVSGITLLLYVGIVYGMAKAFD